MSFLLLVALVLAAALVASDTSRAADPACNTMSLRDGRLVSEATGQNTDAFVLTNQSSSTCTLDGYPRIVLLAGHGRALPFKYTRNGDQMIAPSRPRTVRILPGRSAYFAIDKYRCDIHAIASAVVVHVLLPGSTHWLEHTLRRFRPFDFCPAEVPSQSVAISPIVATYLDIFHQ